jgi:stage II sporulation protein D
MLLWAALASALPPPNIRVLVEDAQIVTISAGGLPLETIGNTRPLPGQRTPRDTVTIRSTEEGLAIGDIIVGRELSLSARGRPLRIEDRTFRDGLTVLWERPEALLVINRLPLEDYLVGLIGSEISPAWPVEAQKAQAVAARTYALYQAEALRKGGSAQPYDVTGSVLSQVYEGAHREDHRARVAVTATRGEVLLRNGSILKAYFHSCCGGRTEHAHNVWPGEKGPPVKEDPFCERSPRSVWSWRMALPAVTEKLRVNGIEIGAISEIAAESEADDPRTATLLFMSENRVVPVKATELRRIFGFAEIKSTWFAASIDAGDLVLIGRGYGHGVGMCQWGAKGMAEQGKSYREILNFYYPDGELRTAY